MVMCKEHMYIANGMWSHIIDMHEKGEQIDGEKFNLYSPKDIYMYRIYTNMKKKCIVYYLFYISATISDPQM